MINFGWEEATQANTCSEVMTQSLSERATLKSPSQDVFFPLGRGGPAITQAIF